jgi:hypothetical protein
VAANGALNPAVAYGINSWSLAYAIGPIVGAIIGMNLYAILFATERVTDEPLSVLTPPANLKKFSQAGTTTKTKKKTRR